RLRHTDRSRAVVPRRRHAAGNPDLGQHDRAEPAVPLARAVDHLLPRHCAGAGGARREPARRRPARPARPAPCEADVSPLLAVRDLKTHFFTVDGVTRAVDGVSFDVFPGETLGIVGESGCGKSVTALSIMRLLPPRLARTVNGHVTFESRDLVQLDEGEMRKLRGNRLAMIFQEPMTSLNPVLTVGHQIAESVRIHTGASASAANARAIEMLRLVKIP